MLIERDVNHKYTLDGRHVPGVTGLLEAAGFIDTRHFTQETRERGTLVHMACEYWDRGVPMPGLVLLPEVAGRLRAWEKFVREMDFVCLDIEKIIGSKLWGYAGQLDRRGYIERGLALLDIKSGDPTPADAWQTAGYERCVDGYHRRFGVHLKDTGDYKLVEHDGLNDWDKFRVALDSWNIRSEHGLIREDD